MKTPTEIKDMAYAHSDALVAASAKTSRQKDGWFPDFELERTYVNAYTEGRREALEMAQGLVDAIRRVESLPDSDMAYETLIETVEKFEERKDGK